MHMYIHTDTHTLTCMCCLSLDTRYLTDVLIHLYMTLCLNCRLSRLHGMCSRQVQERDRCRRLQRLSFLHILGCRERAADKLYVQPRLHRPRWSRVHGVRCRELQGHQRLSRLHAMLTRQIQYSHGFQLRGDVQRLSRAHVFWGRQQGASELHVQPRLHRPRWSRVQDVRCRELQGHQRLSRLHAMPTRQILCCGGRHCCLHLRRLCSRQVLSSKRFDRLQQLYRWHVLGGEWCRVLGLSGIGNVSSGKWQRGQLHMQSGV